MLKKILLSLMVLSISSVMISCSTMKKNQTAGDTEMEGYERITEREFTNEGAVMSDEEIAYLKEEQAGPGAKNVLFDYDSYNIREDAKPVLDNVASVLNKKREVNVVIEGHGDERGTNEYNLALGENRAIATKNYLRSQGVSVSRVTTVTYGEEKPVCTYHEESCWQRNRRSAIKLTDLD